MSESSGFFVSQNGDRKYTTDWLAKYIAALVTTGVYKDELAVRASDGMTVTVQPGRAWLKGYLYSNDAPLEISIKNADSAMPRRDTVVVRLNLTDRTITTMVLTGAFGTAPVAPDISRTSDIYDLKLAEISVPAGTTRMTQSLIKDTRLDDSVCGITVSAVQHIPTAEFLTQMEADFQTWFDQVKGILGEDEAAQLYQAIQAHTGNKSNPHSVTAAQVGAVPTSRKINNKALTSDVTLTAQDVGAAQASHTHTDLAPAYTYGTTDLTPGTSPLETGRLYFVYE